MNKLIPAIVLLIAVYTAWYLVNRPAEQANQANHDDNALAIAFAERKSGVQVQGKGAVIKILPDDNEGSRHQRFIVKLHSGQTLLISHNIDLASRLSDLAVGDDVAFYGEYDWNPKGGVIHWTHHDPRGRHIPGWLKYKGRTYQ